MKKQKKKIARKAKSTARSDARSQSKKGEMIQLLKRSDGVTLPQLMDTSGWQAHSVRGFLSGALRKGIGLKVNFTKRDDGQRVYRIA